MSLYFLFFLSGFPALIYQIVWQRSLFAIYGVNIESVTMVVSVFMLGLGLGSLAGGAVSRNSKVPLLVVFGLVELGIAGFGLISLRLFHQVAVLTAGAPLLETGLVSFGLVVFPTILMGSTMPLLVAYLVPRSRSVGRSVAILYFVNTLGSAAACFAAANVTMPLMGQSGSVQLAAAVNAAIGAAVLALHFASQKRAAWSADAGRREEHPVRTDCLLPLPLVVVLSGAAGFIALSYEMVWVRLYSFASGGEPKAFPYVLGAYLTGIAFGSLFSRRVCRDEPGKNGARDLRMVALFIATANAASFLTVPGLAFALRYTSYPKTIPMITLAAGFLGATFPLLCHLSIRADARVGAGLSYLYLSNIIGSTLGGFVTGFVLMDIWPLRTICVVLAWSGLALAMALIVPLRPVGAGLRAGVATCAALGVLTVAFSGPLFEDIYERMQKKGRYQPAARFHRIIETRSGVITVDQDGTVYGGGVYDGRFNVDLTHDTNNIVRAYAISLFHPNPREVLMIGLSSGSWAQVIANHPQVDRLTVVEINPGYLRIIPESPRVAGLLRNPKIEIVIDDGRRWLLRNPSKRFDLIVMNTTYYWRSNVSNLLSMEFLRLIRQHLKPDGVHYYNTTSSGEAFLTGVTAFPQALRVLNFLAVSDRPLKIDKERWQRVLMAYQIEGRPVFELGRQDQRKALEDVVSLADTLNQGDPSVVASVGSADSLRRYFQGLRIITDDNMGAEWVPTRARASF